MTFKPGDTLTAADLNAALANYVPIAALAATAAGQGGELVGLTSGDTIQSFIAKLIGSNGAGIIGAANGNSVQAFLNSLMASTGAAIIGYGAGTVKGALDATSFSISDLASRASYLGTYPSALPNEVIQITGGGGSGGTPGTYVGGTSGSFSGFTWSVVVGSDGKAVPRIDTPGLSTGTTAPTLVMPTIPGLTGATTPVAVVGTIPVNRLFMSPSSDGSQRVGWINNGGTLSPYLMAGVQYAELSAQSAFSILSGLKKITNAYAVLPTLTVNGRPVQPTLMSYDRRICEGKYLDDGTPYEPLGPSAQVKPAVKLASRYQYLAPIIYNSRPLLPFSMSYDRRVPYGQYLDTGELFLDGITGGATADRSLMRVNQTPTGLSIFMAGAKSRWVEHIFAHETGTASGGAYDIWHLKGAWDTALAGFAPSRQQQLLRSDAEVETAVWTTAAGAGNFVGGSVHGAQVQSSAVMLVDGKVTTLNQTASYTAKRIEVFQQSVLYTFGSGNSVKLIDLYTRWVFEGGDIRIGCAVQWPASPAQVQQTYFGILPVFRTQGSGPSGAGSAVEIVTTGRRSPLFVPEDLSTSGYTEVDTTAEEMIGYGAGGYEFRLRKTRGWTYSGRLSYYAPSVQNKMYQNVYGPNYTPVANQSDWFESVISVYNPY